ncbi:MAG TPA: gas vesicle protein [Enteractinococcus sp.]
MEPTRNPEVSLSDLITVLLDKGTYLNVDLIISVADIPLIGVNLRATIAGMETMLEYGMMRDWDEKTRAWVRQSVARHFPLADGEEVIAKMAGGYFHEGWAKTWRPGSVFVTNQRLVVFRREPKEILWETQLAHIKALRLSEQQTIGSEIRTRLLVDTADGITAMLSASAPERIRELIAQQLPHLKGSQQIEPPAASKPVTQHAWYLEQRADGTLWRGGTLTLDDERMLWRAPTDARHAVNLPWKELHGVDLIEMRAPSGEGRSLHISTAQGDVSFGIAQPERWALVLSQRLTEGDSSKEDSHVRN